MNMKANWKTILSRCVLFVITAATAIPLLWLVVLSFKSDTDILNNPFSLPEHIDLANYRRALDTLPLFKMFGNTLIVAVFALLISLVCTFMISYAITRLHFDHAKIPNGLYLLFVSGLTIPPYCGNGAAGKQGVPDFSIGSNNDGIGSSFNGRISERISDRNRRSGHY